MGNTHPSSPGGSSFGARDVSKPAAALANHSAVSTGSREISATKPSCTALPVVKPNKRNATMYCQRLVLGLGPALSLGTMRNEIRCDRLFCLVSVPSPLSNVPETLGSSPSVPGSSKMKGVYFPSKSVSTFSWTRDHTAARSARKLPVIVNEKCQSCIGQCMDK